MSGLRPIATSDAPPILAAVHGSRDALRREMEWYRDKYDTSLTFARRMRSHFSTGIRLHE